MVTGRPVYSLPEFRLANTWGLFHRNFTARSILHLDEDSIFRILHTYSLEIEIRGGNVAHLYFSHAALIVLHNLDRIRNRSHPSILRVPLSPRHRICHL